MKDQNTRIALVPDTKLEIPRLLVGQDAAVELACACLISGGHLLLEGVPGVGKTTLAKGLAKLFSGKFQRVQMTSDLLPSDFLGYFRPNPSTRELELKRGPIFTEVLLADELNRAPPKTQSALLEAMAEGQVTLDGQSIALPKPFFVVATQNPFDSHGVFPLAESELDRFLMRIELSLPPEHAEAELWLNPDRLSNPESLPQLGRWEDLRLLQGKVREVEIERTVFDYAQNIVRAIRDHDSIAKGVSVRGGQHLVLAARALAHLRGRSYVIPQDVFDVSGPVLAHRVQMEPQGRTLGETRLFVDGIVSSIRRPN